MIANVLLRAGVAFGVFAGATGTLFFLLRLCGLPPASSWLAILLGAAAAFFAVRAVPAIAPREAAPFRWTWLSVGVLAVQLLLAVAGFVSTTSNNPKGEWDATAIWNVRAKFLAEPGPAWKLAFSPLLDTSHPDYPLLLSGLIAAVPQPIPIALLFYLGSIAVLAGAVSALRSPLAGMLSAIVLLDVSAFTFQVPTQYADIPLAFFFTGAVAFLALGFDDPRWLPFAGLFAGFAAWTKNEGMVLVGVAVVALAFANRRTLPRFLLGATPLLAVVLLFRFAIAPASDPFLKLSFGDAIGRAFQWGRWAQITKAFAVETYALNDWITHPLLLLAILAVALRFDGSVWRSRRQFALAGITIGMLAAYFAIFLITPSDLTWHLSTALNRLLVQVIPLVVLCVITSLSIPQSIQGTADTKKPSSAASRSSAPRRGKARA